MKMVDKQNILKVVLKVPRITGAKAILPILIIILSVITPIIAGIIFPDKIKRSFILSIIIYLGVGYYFIKVLFWNFYGQEEMIFHKEYIHIYENYRFFRLTKKAANYQNISVSMLPYTNQNNKKFKYKKLVYLKLEIDDDFFISSIPIPIEVWRCQREKIITYSKIKNYNT